MNTGWAAEWAKLFRERENPHIITVGIGTVLDTLPDLRIQFGQHIILTKEDLIVSASLVDGYKGKYFDNGVEQEVVVKMDLLAGDEVILIPTADKQTFYVLNKVGG